MDYVLCRPTFSAEGKLSEGESLRDDLDIKRCRFVRKLE